MENKEKPINTKESVHEWFGLSYASYLVLQRSILQSMPPNWQEKFTELLKEVLDASQELDPPSSFMVRATDSNHKFIADPYRDYQRGRRKVKLQNKPT